MVPIEHFLILAAAFVVQVVAFFLLLRAQRLLRQAMVRQSKELAQLAHFIVYQVPGEPNRDKTAVDTSIGIVKKLEGEELKQD